MAFSRISEALKTDAFNFDIFSTIQSFGPGFFVDFHMSTRNKVAILPITYGSGHRVPSQTMVEEIKRVCNAFHFCIRK